MFTWHLWRSVLPFCYRSAHQALIRDAQLWNSPELPGSVWRWTLPDSRRELWRSHGEAKKSLPKCQGAQGGVSWFEIPLLWLLDKSGYCDNELQRQRDISRGILHMSESGNIEFSRCDCIKLLLCFLRWSTVLVLFQGTAGTSWRSSCSPFLALVSPSCRLCLLPSLKDSLHQQTLLTPWLSTWSCSTNFVNNKSQEVTCVESSVIM